MTSPPPDDTAVRQADRLRVLAESGHVFAEAVNEVDRLLKIVARRFADVIGDGCYIRLLGADGDTLEPVATYHPDPETETYLRVTTDEVSLRVGEGISGKVVATGEPVLMPRLPFEQYRAMTKPQFVPIFERIGLSSLIVVCLQARGSRFGFIALVRNGSDRPGYTEDDLHLVQDLAERAALAIDNARLLDDLERRVRERTRDLESANRELEAFSYSVSHDLRAPLRAIDGFSQVLEEEHGARLDDEGRRVVGVIRRNTQQMGRLIDDLLRFSKISRQAMGTKRVDMGALVGSLIDELRAAAPARALEFRLGALPDARCDPDLIRLVWSNLLGNAMKYTAPKPVAVVEIAGAVADEEVRYTIKDNGAGFDPRYADKLFRVFQRLHKADEFEGNGLGLSLVHRIVTRHGGRVWADGRPDEGATFGFALPKLGAL